MPFRRSTPLIWPLITLFLITGCAGMKKHAPAMATIPGVSGHFPTGRIVDLRLGKALSFETLVDRVASMDLIFVGEVHDNPEHHLLQVQILQGLAERSGPVNIAMESFQRTSQGSLDRYLEGELTEKAFLEEVDWKRSWGIEYHFYRPLLLWAKRNRARVLAINAPSTVVRKVARQGLKGLRADERSQLAGEIDLDNKAHRAYLRGVYEGHVHRELKDFDFFYEAQCVWEDTMAESISGYFRDNRTKLVVFTGNGHIVNKFGVPDRTVRRTPLSMATIMPYPLKESVIIPPGAADYVWLTPAYPHGFRGFHAGEMSRTGHGIGSESRPGKER